MREMNLKLAYLSSPTPPTPLSHRYRAGLGATGTWGTLGFKGLPCPLGI